MNLRLLATLMLLFSSLNAQTPGSIDLSFNPSDNGLANQGSNNRLYGTAIDENGKILLVGEHTMYNGQQTHCIVRIDQNGEIDPVFQTSIGIEVGSIEAVAVQEDGKIVIGGAFTSFGGIPVNAIARLHTDGTLDTDFMAGSIIGGGGVYDIAIQPDGKILIGGGFYCSTSSSNSILRLNTDGTIDSTFNTGTGFNNSVNDIHLLSNGQIITTGIFNQYNGSTALKVARLNTDGSIDNSFSQSYDFQYSVDDSAILPDNKILLSGYGINPNNANQTAKIVRLQSDGQLDTIWYFQGGAVQKVYAQPDGKILRIGSYVNPDYSNNYGIHRLLNDGSIDSSFTPNSFSGFGLGTVDCVSEIINGKVLVGGSFTLFNGVPKSRVSRMYLCTTTEVNEEITSCDFYVSSSGDTLYQSGIYIDTLSTALGCDSIITLNLTILNQETTIESLFSLPSDQDTCNGLLAMNISGNGNFVIYIDNGIETAISSEYMLFTDLCSGIHNLQIMNNCGDTTTAQFVIPVDSNYVFNNPFIDSIAVDSLGTTVENCELYYNSIDTAFIDSLWANGNTVNVIWNIVDSNGSDFDTSTYVLNSGNGVYWLQLSVFCPTRAIGDYFTVTEAIYFEDGDISTADLAYLDEDIFELYPNPTNDVVTIRFEVPDAELMIYDTQGKRIHTQKLISGESTSLETVETGIYLFEFITERGKIVKRVVKH